MSRDRTRLALVAALFLMDAIAYGITYLQVRKLHPHYLDPRYEHAAPPSPIAPMRRAK